MAIVMFINGLCYRGLEEGEEGKNSPYIRQVLETKPPLY